MTRLLAIPLLAWLPVCAYAGDAVVTLQVRPDVRLETLRAIARLGEAEVRTLDRDMWAYEILREEYGSSHEKLRVIFAEYNDGKERFKEGEVVNLPPAPEWLFDVRETVNDSATVKEYLETRMGAAGPRTLRAVARKSGVSLARVEILQPGRRIVLPYVAEAVSVEIDETKVAEIEKIVEGLKESDDAIEIMEVSTEMSLIPHATLAAADPTCPIIPISPQAHCNVEDLERFPKVQRTLVAVIDSGVPNGDARFNFWRNPGEDKKRRYIDDDRNHYVDDIIGTDMLLHGGYPRDEVTVSSMRNHGTHVAGLASCRLASDAHRAAINDRIELMILKVASADGSVSPAAVMNSIAYAMKYNAHIVNLSLEGSIHDEAVEAFMTNGAKVLFVTAAGNGVASVGQSLPELEVYPALLSTTLPNVMSVAAHDGDGARACFSNYGAETVDIAAPGLKVHSTIANGVGELSGTSQATPLVTLGAALLHARGLDDPHEIRERLVISADFKAKLRGVVRSEGTLNIGKALAYDRDLVVTRSGTREGTLIGFAGILLPDQTIVPAASIRKVINGYDDNAERRVKVITKSGATFANAVPDMTIRTDAGDVTIVAADILEIIPRMRQ